MSDPEVPPGMPDWRSLFLGSPAATLVIDAASGRIVEASESAVRFYGYPRARLVGMPIGEINTLPPAVIAARMAEAGGAPGTTRTFRFPHRLASGEERMVEVHSGPVTHRGRPALLSVIHDVTELAAVEAHRDLLATAVEQSAGPVIITDPDARIIYVNPAFERLTGYSREEVAGRNPRLLQSGRQSRAQYEDLWRTLAAGQTWQGEFANRRRDGSELIEEALISPVHDAASGRLHYVAVKRDVTAERALQRAREHLAAIVESAVDAAFAVAIDGTYLAWNDAAARMYGWPAGEVLGRSIFELVPAEEHASIRDWIARVAAGESIGPVDTTHLGAGGRRIALSVIASPVRDATGRVTGVATIARDVSAERAAAAERAALEAQLRQAQRLEALGRLAGGIAHDFNNLLTVMTGHARLVAGELTGPQLADQEVVLHAAERAADLTHRLLAFARATPVAPRRVHLDDAVRDACRLVGRLVPERVRFELRAGCDAEVIADPVELEQLVINLVVNAVDAIPDDGSIVVATGRDADDAVIEVADTGVGMDDATAERAFDPFYTTKDPGQGTGLGLSTVYATVTRAGGRVSIRSSSGAGSTLRVCLPVAPAPAPGAASAGTAAPGRTEHVLVVEDAALLRDLAVRMLQGAGYRVSTMSATEAVRAGADGIDCVLADVVMPDLSGPQLLARLGRAVPAVFVSGYAGQSLGDELEGLAHRRFLEKPYDRDSLLEAVRAVIDAGRV